MISNLLDFGKFKNENKNFDKKVVDEILSFKDYYSDYQSKWEKTFRFKKPDGRYAHTRVSFRIMDEINLLGIWQFI